MSNSDDYRYHTLPKASAEASAAAVAAARRRRDLLLSAEQRAISASSRSLRTSSPRWREHYAMVSSKWGAIASGATTISPTIWDDIQKQKAKGGYPWTHLSHDQDAEVWINPVKLPADITTVTMRRKDHSIPREWFHLPKGADPPTVDDLLRDSSPEQEAGNGERAKSPPICGRSRSKSKDRKLHKHSVDNGHRAYVDDGGYEPVGANRSTLSIQPLNRMAPSPKTAKKVGQKEPVMASAVVKNKEVIPPRKALTALPEPPVINRDTKPEIRINTTKSKSNDNDGGYEPVGKKEYEEVKPLSDPPPTYAKVDLEAKEKAKKAKAESSEQKEKSDKEKKQEEKEKREREEKERKQREKAEKEKKEKDERERKLLEKAEKEKKEKEERERKQREKANKERREKEEKEQKQKEKLEREREEKERKLREKEEKEKAAREKLEKERLEKEKKEKAAREKLEKEEIEREKAQTAKLEKEEMEKEKALRLKLEKEEIEKEKALRLKLEKEEMEREKALKLEKDQVDLKTEKEQLAPTFAHSVHNDPYDGFFQPAAASDNLSLEQNLADQSYDSNEQEMQNDEDQWMFNQSHFSDEMDNATDGLGIPEVGPDGKPLSKKEIEKMKKKLEKEQKKKEKEQKQKEQKEEKERKKREKELKKEKEMKEKKEKEERAKAEKLRKKEEKQQKENDKKREGKNLADIAKEKSTEKLKALGQILIEEDQQCQKEDDKADKEEEEEKVDVDNDDFERFSSDDQKWPQFDPTNEFDNQFNEPMTKDHHRCDLLKQPDWPTYEQDLQKGRSRRDQGKKKREMPKLQMPKVDVKSKLNTMNESIKNARLPRPNEIKDGYLNSNFHKSFHQPLAVRTRVEQVDVQQQREMMTKRKTPAELGQLNHPLDIPLPKFKLPQKKDDTQSLNIDDLDANRSRLYATLPKSWRQQNLVTSTKIMDDKEEAEKRQALVKTKTPAQLAEFNSIADIPIPSKVKAILSPSERKIIAQKQKRLSASAGRVDNMKSSQLSVEAAAVPAAASKTSWKDTKLITNVREDLDPDEARRRRNLTQTKSPAQLAEFNAFSDIPVPSKISSMFKWQQPAKKSKSEADLKKSVTAEAAPAPVQVAVLPAWKDQKFITNVKVEEDQGEVERRRALATSKSPAELSQIASFQDIPVPTTLKRMMKSGDKKKLRSEPEKPFSMTKIFSRSLTNLATSDKAKTRGQTLIVVKKVEDPEVQAARAETVKTKTVAELAHIGSLSDLPIPSSIQQLTLKRQRKRSESSDPKKMQDYLPDSLKSELLVSSKTGQEPEELKTRQELVRSKTPTELSKFNSLSDIPIPKVFKSKGTSPSRPTSPESVQSQSFYNSLPRSLKSEVLVRSRLEEPEIQRLRSETVKAKSVNELSQINSFDDFPLPRPLENLVGRTGSRPVERKKRFREKQRSMSTKSLQEKLVPDSFRTQQLLVVSKFEDPEVIRYRKEITQSRSVSELSQISRLSDIPIPTTLERMMNKKRLKKSKSGDDVPQMKDYSHLSPMAIHDSIYSTLPRSLKSEVLVRSRVESPEKLKARKELVQSKSVNELSQLKSLSDVPIPTPIQNLLHGKRSKLSNGDGVNDDDSSSMFSGATGISSRIGHYDIYASLPSSMKRGVLVRTKTDDPYETLVKRRAIVESKSPAELSQISNFSEIPLPSKIEDWLHHSGERGKREAISRSFRELTPRKVLPEALTKQCLVRSRTENPEVLQQRQQVILNNSPHELSKIRNLNELPLPVKRLQMPDIPLPSVKYMFRPPTRVRRVDEACQTVESSFEGFTPASTPRLLELATFSDDDALRFEMSSPDSAVLPRDTDFGYEIIEKENEADADDDESSVSVADHYKGTPQLKSKKKRHVHRNSNDADQAKRKGETPPPIPPKKAQLARDREGSVETTTSFHSLVTEDDHRIQSRPLPSPPTPSRSKRKVDDEFHSLRSSCTLVGTQDHDQVDETLADSLIESMHTCLDTLNPDDVTLHSCDETMGNASDDDEGEFAAEMLPHDKKDRDATPT